MTDDIIYSKLTEIAKNRNITINKADVDKEFKYLGIDSISGISLIIDVENAFKIQFSDETLVNIKTFANLVKEISKLVK